MSRMTTELPTASCAFCLEPFAPRNPDQRYCSGLCRARHWKAQHPRQALKLCAVCGDTLGGPTGQVPANARFCSPRCRFAHLVQQIKRCAECGQPISAKRPDARFCSQRCKSKHWDRRHSFFREIRELSPIGRLKILPSVRRETGLGAFGGEFVEPTPCQPASGDFSP